MFHAGARVEDPARLAELQNLVADWPLALVDIQDLNAELVRGNESLRQALKNAGYWHEGEP